MNFTRKEEKEERTPTGGGVEEKEREGGWTRLASRTREVGMRYMSCLMDAKIRDEAGLRRQARSRVQGGSATLRTGGKELVTYGRQEARLS